VNNDFVCGVCVYVRLFLNYFVCVFGFVFVVRHFFSVTSIVNIFPLWLGLTKFNLHGIR